MILGICGAGGLGREVLDLAKEINIISKKWEKIVFIDEFKKETVINGAEVFTFDAFKVNWTAENSKVVIAIGEPKVRTRLREEMTKSGYTLQSLIHPAAFVGAETQISDGAIIQFGSFISCNVRIGANVLIQPNSSVGHDSIIGNDAVISSYVGISGSCTIGERAYIGVSVPVKVKISIGADSIVGMGSVVMRDIPENVIALGNPARAMKNNDDGRVFK
jgi:sugar O-acyltransferase (sialic acid O-acetyltransferase NeuD family)